MANSAAQLHSLLQQVRAQNSQVATAWATVLGAKWDSPDFARRQAEVVRLLAETVDAIGSLGDSSTARRMGTYVPKWWYAVITPRADWLDTSKNAANIISDSDLDHLGSAADILEARLGGTAVAPQVNILERLAEQCATWETLISEAVELPQALRLTLLGHVQHLVWLISNVDVFGEGRVTQEAHAVFGEITTATAKVDARRLPKWREALAGMFTALVLINGVTDGAVEVLEAATDTVDAVTHLVSATASAVDGADRPEVGRVEAPAEAADTDVEP